MSDLGQLMQSLTGNPVLLQVVALVVVLWWCRRQLLEWGERYDRRTDLQERRTRAQEAAGEALQTLAGRESHTVTVLEGKVVPVSLVRPGVNGMDPDASQH